MRDRILRHWAVVALFLLLAFAGDRLLGMAADRVVRASEFRLSQLYRGSVDADIAIFGNSRGVHSVFGPRLAERTCRRTFNASYNGLSALGMTAVFQDYLERNRKPAFVLVEVSAGTVWNRTASELKTFTPLSQRLDRLYAAADSHYRFWSLLTHLYRYDTELFLRCLFYLRHDDQDWIMGERQIDRGMIRGYNGLAEELLDDSQDRLDAFHEFAAAARKAGVKPIFFMAPYHPIVFVRVPELAPWIERQGSALAGDAPLLDLSHALAGNEDFGDPIHLNKAGSYRLIEQILQTEAGRSMQQCTTPGSAPG